MAEKQFRSEKYFIEMPEIPILCIGACALGCAAIQSADSGSLPGQTIPGQECAAAIALC